MPGQPVKLGWAGVGVSGSLGGRGATVVVVLVVADVVVVTIVVVGGSCEQTKSTVIPPLLMPSGPRCMAATTVSPSTSSPSSMVTRPGWLSTSGTVTTVGAAHLGLRAAALGELPESTRRC